MKDSEKRFIEKTVAKLRVKKADFEHQLQGYRREMAFLEEEIKQCEKYLAEGIELIEVREPA